MHQSPVGQLEYTIFNNLLYKYATIIVVSSTTPSSFIHRLCASEAMMLHALSGSVHAAVIFATSSFVMNSHNPSVARTRNLSVLSNLRVKISGSLLTPAVCAIVSPNDRDMASPGMSMWPNQTRAGPSTPSSYLFGVRVLVFECCCSLVILRVSKL